MRRNKQKTKSLKKEALLCLSLACLVLVAGFSVSVARAAWEEPQAQAPGGNIYAPLNVGSDSQIKQGRLLLDPLYNPWGSLPTIDNQLEVLGNGASFTTLAAVNSLIVDTDTLWVDALANQTSIGVGTASPDSTSILNVIGGTFSATTNGTTLAISASSVNDHGLAATAQGGETAAVYGDSAGGYGVYGNNDFGGYGVYGYSRDVSAVRGVTAAAYDPSNRMAAIYGRASGLGAWAGYFQQRLFGSDQIVGRKFVPNRLQNSQIPYTANWRVRQIDESALREPQIVAFDGSHLWVASFGWDTNFVSVYEASTGALVVEIQDGQITREINSMIYAEGYIWAANDCPNGRPCLVRFNTTTYAYNTYNLDTNSGTAIDLVYDNAGHIWTANSVTVGGNPRTSISRLTISDGSVLTATTITEQCQSQTLRAPSGITYDGTDLWVSFPGSPEGIAKVSTTAPYTATAYCNDVIGHGPSDIAYDNTNSRIWVAYRPGSPGNNSGMGKFNMDGSLDQEYLYPAFSHFLQGLTQIRFDDQSTGGPFIWTNNSSAGSLSYLFKFNISSATVAHEYELSANMEDFTFDRVTAGGPYVWGAHMSSGEISRSKIDADYSTTYYVSHAGMGARDLIFDGTYVWLTNGRGYTVGKYRAVDGKKIGNYYAGQQPTHLIYDGRYVWSVTNYNQHNKNLVQLDAATGAVVGEYPRSVNYSGRDAVFDGRHLWIVGGADNWLERIRLSNCNSGTCNGTGTAIYMNLQAGSSAIRPNKIIFDGADLWVTHGAADQTNKISRITFNDSGVTVADTFTLSDVSGSLIRGEPNISAIEYDGTYIWIGTIQADSEGNSVYKIIPNDGSIAGKFPIYHEPGRCANSKNYCARDADCGAGESCLANVTVADSGCPSGNCWGREAGVDVMVFDGINMWIFSGTAIDNGIRRECDDGIDNDGDFRIDRQGGNADTECENYYDLHESDTGPECSDGLDNDGNGLCDFSGAAGYPGCSGKPDPRCSSANDISEAISTNANFLTRIVAATNQIVDSVYVNENYFSASELVFDGNHVWYGGTKYHALGQFYSGSGAGLTDLAGSVALQPSIRSDSIQSGSFAINGSATFSANFTVVGDLVVQNNSWGGSGDELENFGTGCDDGKFAKGVEIGATSSGIVTGSSTSDDAVDVATDGTYLYTIGHEDVLAGFRIEKRNISTGELVSGFGGTGGDPDGVVTGTVSGGFPNQVAIDSNYMYLVGEGSSGYWRIEKRSLATGNLCTAAECGTGFGFNGSGNPTGDGIVTGASTTHEIAAIAIDTSAGYMYVIGDLGGAPWIRLERRSLLDGSLDYAVGGGAPTPSPIEDTYSSRIVLDINAGFMYVTGEDAWAEGRVDKRRMSDGTWCTTASPCGGTGFGYNGSGVFTGDGSVDTDIETPTRDVVGIGIDSIYMYLTVTDSIGPGQYIEKRLLSTGQLVSGFGTGGRVFTPSVRVNDIIINGDNFITVGEDEITSAWRIEKRHTSDGGLCTTADPCDGIGFGTDAAGNPTGSGIAFSASETSIAYAIAAASADIYVVGNDDTPDWRLEKRLLSTGEIGTFGAGSQLQCRPL